MDINELLSSGELDNLPIRVKTSRQVTTETLTERLVKKPSYSLFNWDAFNKTIGGIREREFSIICGPTGVGKTTLIANMAANIAAQNIPVFIGSVEITTSDFQEIMISAVTKKSIESLDDKKIREAAICFPQIFNSEKNVVFSPYDTRVKPRQLLEDLLVSHRQFGTKVAFIDNLNFLLEVGGDRNQLVEMDQAVHDFVIFTKKIPMHIFMIMHPKKTEGGRVESEFDIKGSSTSVQEASNVMLWNRLRQPADAPSGFSAELCRELKFCKIRKNGKFVGTKIIYSVDEKSTGLSEVGIL